MSDWLVNSVRNSAPSGEAASLALASLRGDDLAMMALQDKCEEEGWMHSPFSVGQKVFLVTVTLYYVGEVESVGLGWVRLKNASWVHWTGRLSELFRHGLVGFPADSRRKPRTEQIYGVKARVWLQSLVADYEWPFDLPGTSLE